MADTAVLISASLALVRHQIALQDHGYDAIAPAACLFTPHLMLVLPVPTHGGMAGLS